MEEVIQTHWEYLSLWDRMVRRRTTYHVIRGKCYAHNSKKGWFKPKESIDKH